MIHAVPPRMWYVEHFLIPSLRAQGLEFTVYVDTEGLGNLAAFLASVYALHGDGTWHIQDDVLICPDFAERIAALDHGVVNGFCCPVSDDLPDRTGDVQPYYFWNGFPCVRIPDDYARDFARWVKLSRHSRTADKLIAKGKGDDFLFKEYLRACHRLVKVHNAAPNLVEHVDFLLGGSIANTDRGGTARSAIWPWPEAVDELARRIEQYRMTKPL